MNTMGYFTREELRGLGVILFSILIGFLLGMAAHAILL